MEYGKWRRLELSLFRAKSALEQFEQLQLQLDWEELENMDRDEVDLIVTMIRQCRGDLWKERKKTFPREEKINKNLKRWEELKKQGGVLARRSEYWLFRHKDNLREILRSRGSLQVARNECDKWNDIADLFCE